MLGALAAGLGGCSQGSQTPLPSLSKDTGRVLSKEEQEKAIRDLAGMPAKK